MLNWLLASGSKRQSSLRVSKVERINHSFADHKSHPIVDNHPIGYPQLVAFIKSDNNFLIARKYGFLRARVLLYRQDELSVLEKDLIAMDRDDNIHRPLALYSIFQTIREQNVDDPVYSREVFFALHVCIHGLVVRKTAILSESMDLLTRLQHEYLAKRRPWVSESGRWEIR